MNNTHALTTTTFDLPGYRIIKSHGVVRGIIVRSRSVVGNIGAGLQSLFGGNITIYTDLCEQAREEAFQLMLSHAGQLGANAVIGRIRPACSAAGKNSSGSSSPRVGWRHRTSASTLCTLSSTALILGW